MGASDADIVRILIVDDHEVLVDAMRRALEREHDLEVVATADRLETALELIAEHRPDVVVTDYRLPDGDGIALTTEVTQRWSDTAVVMLTGLEDDQIALAAVRAGCLGHLVKTSPLEEVLTSVRAAARGETHYDPALLSRLLPLLSGRAEREADPGLTAREQEVLEAMALGATNRVIGESLFIATDTVRNHVSSILSKLGAHSKLEAVTVAAQRGIIEPVQPVTGSR